MKTVIRVEHSISNKGIWHHHSEDKLYYPLDSIRQRHELSFRTREQEFGFDAFDKQPHLDKYYCAYKTIEQFRMWIKDCEIKWLFAQGFNILMIDVSECFEGRDQILFEKQYVIQTKIINSLFQ